MKKLLLPIFALIAGAATANAGANVFASQLKAADGNISFILNTDADALTFNCIKDGKVVATADLGKGVKGLNTFAIPAMAGVEDGDYSWSITASAAANTEFAQFTSNDDADLWIPGKGLAADVNPASAGFGRIYTTIPGKSAYTGTVTEGGLYALNADLTLISKEPYTGGVNWDKESASSPNSVNVADNGQVFIADWCDSNGNLFYAEPDALDKEFKSVFAAGETDAAGLVTIDGVAVHGSIQDVAFYGEGDSRVLYTTDEDLHSNNGEIFVYNIGTLASPWSKAPSAEWGNMEGKFANANQRLASDGRGGLWVSQYRWAEAAANPCIMHITDKGVWDFTTGDKSIFTGNTPCGAMNVNKEGTLLVSVCDSNGSMFTVCKITWGEDGIPALVPYIEKQGIGSHKARMFNFTFDAADNLYVMVNASGAEGGLIGFALPKEKNEYTTPANDKVKLSSGVESIADTTAKTITYVGGVISSTEEATVYNAAGAAVAKGTQIDAAQLAAGIYIVRAGGQSLKIVK